MGTVRKRGAIPNKRAGLGVFVDYASLTEDQLRVFDVRNSKAEPTM